MSLHEQLAEAEGLAGHPAWQRLRDEFAAQQESLAREMTGGIDDFTRYREAVARHGQIAAILDWPTRQVEALRAEIDKEK